MHNLYLLCLKKVNHGIHDLPVFSHLSKKICILVYLRRRDTTVSTSGVCENISNPLTDST
jgi:hypothetical protein